MANTEIAGLGTRIEKLEAELRAAESQTASVADLEFALQQLEKPLADLRKRSASLEFSEPSRKAQLIQELIALAASKGVALTPADAYVLLEAEAIFQRLGATVAFSEQQACLQSPESLAAQARALQAQEAAMGRPLSASQAVAKLMAKRREVSRNLPRPRGSGGIVELPPIA